MTWSFMNRQSQLWMATLWSGGLLMTLWPGVATAETTLQNSVCKDGITWTFSAPVPVGQFVNGDYYVVGPVTITAIDPAPQTSAPYMNGSVKNLPTPNNYSSFDQRLNDGTDQSWNFDPAWRQYPPINLVPGDSLVSSRSLSPEQYHNVPAAMEENSTSISPVASLSILTVLSAEPSADAFRPSYCNHTQRIYHANDLNRALLPSLAPPNPAQTPALAYFENLFRRPWVDLNPFLFDAPAEYMPDYGQRIALADSFVGLLLSLNFPADQKVTLTNYFVQYAIDLCGCLETGQRWPAFGGHRSGRKMPIILAGILFGDPDMKNVSDRFPDAFGEDMQTVYVNQIPPAGTYQQSWEGSKVIYGGHYGVHNDGTPVDSSNDGLYGPYEHRQPEDWPILAPPGEQLGEAYRRCCTSNSWIGEALAMRLLPGAQTAWNHPAFFDYADRWMQLDDDNLAVQDIKRLSGYDYTVDWERQGQTALFLQGAVPAPSFIDDMWHAYRGWAAPADTTPPTVPAGLQLTVISNTQINLKWDPSTDNVQVVGYKIYRNGVEAGATVTHEYHDTGLAPALAYTYRIAAYDANGNMSAQSGGAAGTTEGPPDTTAPTVPAGLVAVAVSDTEIDLHWDASTDDFGVAQYRIYRNGVQIATSETTSFASTGLARSKKYTYTVAAVDASGNVSAKSAPASATTNAGPPITTVNIVHTTVCTKDTLTLTHPLVCTIPATQAGNTLVVAWVSYRDYGPVGSLLDDVGNSYSLIPGSLAAHSEMWWAGNIRAGATTIQIYPTQDNQRGPAVVYEISGVNAVDVAAAWESAGEANPVGASVTTQYYPELILASIVPSNAAGNIYPGNPFTNDTTYDLNAWAHLIAPAPGTYQPRWDYSDPGSYTASTVALHYVPNIRVTTSGLLYSRHSQQYTGTLTITNEDRAGLTGPFQVVLTGLTPGVTLVNAKGEVSGASYLTINKTSLAPGQSATAQVNFRNPSHLMIDFTGVVHGVGF